MRTTDSRRVAPSQAGRLGRGLERLQRMSFAEVGSRGRQQMSKSIDRAIFPARELWRRLGVVPARTGMPASSRRQELRLDRFFTGASDDAAVATLGRVCPDACAETVARADRICKGQFDLLGYRGLSFGDPIDWSLDPVAGRRSPGVHWSRINPLNAEGFGDCKVIWELSRHQWAVTLAQACRLTGDTRYAVRAVDLIEEWLAANPPGAGINWSSSLEVALRLVSWCWTLALLRPVTEQSERLGPIYEAIRTHAAHVCRYLSYYFSPNTHLTGEALALFYAGLLFPECRDAARWRALGQQILVDESTRQVTDDGVGVEQATCYHRYTIEIYLHLLLLARQNDIAIPAVVAERTERMLEFLLALNAPAATMPSIGDADGGWLMPLAAREPRDCRGIFGLGALAFGRTDFANAAGGPVPEVGWMLGRDGLEQLDRLRTGVVASQRSRAFETGGCAIMRGSRADGELRLVLHTGALGLDLTGAHAHADLLSVDCTALGDEYLVDPGTFSYVPGSPWRRHFRSTAAHSTITIDGLSQAEPAGAFSWHHRPRAVLTEWRSDADVDFADARHDGYERLADPVCHRRRVLFVKPRYWIIVDDLIGLDRHEFELRFQFTPRDVICGPDLWTCASGTGTRALWLKPFAAIPLGGAVQCGAEDPIGGWIATDYGQRTPAPCVTYSASARLPNRIATVIVPVDSAGGPIRPPKVEATFDASGALTGLIWSDTGEVILIENDAIRVVAGTQSARTIACELE